MAKGGICKFKYQLWSYLTNLDYEQRTDKDRADRVISMSENHKHRQGITVNRVSNRWVIQKNAKLTVKETNWNF